MTPEQWPLAKRVVAEAIAVDAADRERLIRQAFPNDPALCQELFDLLDNYTLATMRLPMLAGAVVLAREASSVSEPSGRTSGFPDSELLLTGGQPAQFWQPGDMCGRYRIVRHIGGGGMGQVFLADDTELGTAVALKVLSEKWLESPAARTRLRQEARHTAELRGHLHIATLFDCIDTEVNGQRFPVLVMEYVEGTNAKAVIQGGRVAPARTLRWALQIAEAIEYAHDRGILHCDIKPANLQITVDDRIKVLDFGVARAIYHRSDGRELAVGTPAYMAPEQISEGKFTEAGDIYSLGVTLFELVTGRRPFEALSLSALIVEILGAPPLKASSIVPGVPDGLDTLLERALAKAPRHRFQSAAEFRQALAAVVERLHTSPRLVPFRRRAGRYAVMTVGTIAVLALLGFECSWMLDMVLGRTSEFRTESPLGWPIWGARAILPELVFTSLCLLGLVVLRESGRLAVAWPPVQRWCARPLGSLRGWFLHTDPMSLGRALLLMQAAALALFILYFWPLLTSLVHLAMNRPEAPLRALWRGDPATAANHDRYIYFMVAQLSVFPLAWLTVRRWLRQRAANGRPLLAGAVAVTALTVLLIPPKYRLVHHNDGERVTYGVATCYLVGQSGDRGLLFCPLSAPRRMVVSLTDPRLQRSAIPDREEVYTVFEPTENAP